MTTSAEECFDSCALEVRFYFFIFFQMDENNSNLSLFFCKKKFCTRIGVCGWDEDASTLPGGPVVPYPHLLSPLWGDAVGPGPTGPKMWRWSHLLSFCTAGLKRHTLWPPIHCQHLPSTMPPPPCFRMSSNDGDSVSSDHSSFFHIVAVRSIWLVVNCDLVISLSSSVSKTGQISGAE